MQANTNIPFMDHIKMGVEDYHKGFFTWRCSFVQFLAPQGLWEVARFPICQQTLMYFKWVVTPSTNWRSLLLRYFFLMFQFKKIGEGLLLKYNEKGEIGAWYPIESWTSIICIWPDISVLRIDWVVVSNIFYVHPYLGKIPNLTNINGCFWFP